MRLSIICFMVLSINLACTVTENDPQQDLAASPGDVAKILTYELLARPDFMTYNTGDVYALHYAEVCAAYGALKFANQLNDDKLFNELVLHYAKATPAYIPNSANHVDANVYGVLPLEIFIHSKNKKYLSQGLAYANDQWIEPLPSGLTAQTRFWIDDIYMIGVLQVQAFRATGDKVYLQRAAMEINAYINKLQQPNGLFYHGNEAPFYWGRGNGWVAAGLVEILSELPPTNPHYAAILDAYTKMMKTLLENQSDDGMWHQVINEPESFKETSSTAMFGFAMALGVKHKFLPEEPYRKAYIKTWNTLIEYLDEEGRLREVCVGTGQSNDLQYYFNRPRIDGDLHGQAPMLWFANTLFAM